MPQLNTRITATTSTRVTTTTITRIAATLLSALAWYFAFDLSGRYGWLIWLAPLPVLYTSLSSNRRAAFAMLFISMFIGRLSWLSYLLSVLPILPVILFTIFLPLIAALIATRLKAGVFVFPILWTTFEFAAARLMQDGTIISIAYTQSNYLPVMQLVSVTGIYGVTFLLWLFPSSIAYLLHRRKPLYAILAILTPLIILAGAIRLASARPATTQHEISLLSLPESAAASDYIAVIQKQPAGLCLLPEKIAYTDSFPPNTIFGYTETLPDHKQNHAAYIDNTGRKHSDYNKNYLFEGELLDGYRPGKGIDTFTLNDHTVGLAICKDLDFDHFIRQYRVEALFVPAWDFTKDGWLHSRIAIARGIENGFWMARAARLGRLTISDPYGRITAEANNDKGATQTLRTQIGYEHIRTIYGRWGDWFAWCILAAAAYLLMRSFIPPKAS